MALFILARVRCPVFQASLPGISAPNPALSRAQGKEESRLATPRPCRDALGGSPQRAIDSAGEIPAV